MVYHINISQINLNVQQKNRLRIATDFFAFSNGQGVPAPEL